MGTILTKREVMTKKTVAPSGGRKLLDHTPQRLTAFLCLGFTASLGFALSGMANADHIFQFFNFNRFKDSTWDPSLLYTFVSALGSHLILYQSFIAPRWLQKPLYGNEFGIPKPSAVDIKLLLGGVLFGTGWAMSGFCPGPSITSAFGGNKTAILFLVFVFAGFFVGNRITSGPQQQVSNVKEQLGSTVLLFSSLGAAYYFAPPTLSALSSGAAIASPVFGGLIIGISAFAMMLGVGKVFGISGMTSGLIFPSTPTRDRIERWFFFTGLALGGIYTRHYLPRVLISTLAVPHWRILAGGLLVGLGTNLENGCTSGHGICGISRGATRSIVATGTFFVTNVLLSTFALGL